MPVETVRDDTVRADTVPVDRVPASTLPTRTRMEPVSAKRAEAEETRAVPAQDTTGTVGSGTIQVKPRSARLPLSSAGHIRASR